MSQTDLAHSLEPEAEALALIEEAVARRYRVLPLRRQDTSLVVAMEEPANLAAVDEIQFLTGLKIRTVKASAPALAQAMRLHYGASQLPVRADEAKSECRAESPVVRIQQILFAEAVRLGASDLHLDPGERSSRVRFRIDGLLREAFEIPRWLHERLVARIKVIGRMDISERRLPQDGHVKDEKMGFEARLSTLPTQGGEAVVLRLFGDRGRLPSLSDIGGGSDLERRLRAMSHRSQGILIVAGPTGSGKTTTLYAILNELRRRPLNIVTIEDPVEFRVDGIRQVQVADRSKLTFHAALRATLRQDPDVILVGEIRDAETARVAFHASLTGHLVLSTLHATEVTGTLLRLVELGVDRSVIASAMIGAIAQRLVRINCPHCLIEDDPPALFLERFGLRRSDAPKLKRGGGCHECQFTGTSGRAALFEVLELDRTTRQHFIGGREEELLLASSAFRPLATQAVDAVREGRISIQEAYRTCYFGDFQ